MSWMGQALSWGATFGRSRPARLPAAQASSLPSPTLDFGGAYALLRLVNQTEAGWVFEAVARQLPGRPRVALRLLLPPAWAAVRSDVALLHERRPQGLMAVLDWGERHGLGYVVTPWHEQLASPFAPGRPPLSATVWLGLMRHYFRALQRAQEAGLSCQSLAADNLVLVSERQNFHGWRVSLDFGLPLQGAAGARAGSVQQKLAACGLAAVQEPSAPLRAVLARMRHPRRGYFDLWTAYEALRAASAQPSGILCQAA